MFKKVKLTFFILSIISAGQVYAQINFTANDLVPTYSENFGFGANPGSNAGWDDEAEADIAAGNPLYNVPGAGCNTLRPPLPEWFLEYWGYDIRLDEYQYFETLGINNLTVFLGDASDEHRDPGFYCPDHQSLLFDNMYLPIWDGGVNGTAVNENNFYANYVYKTVNIYKDHVKFWEVLNEPDFDYSATGYLDPGQPGNWWENVPDPCDYKLRAPVFHYIRLLRISYEVIKYVDPEAFVAVGGLGYESFLDIILRYSDNPDNGQITAEYPMTGGAYFDALSYHSYPHYDGSLRYWSNDEGGFVYTRHSDAAAEGVTASKEDFEVVLHDYGYDGSSFPEKVWLITEGNLPAESFEPEYFGSVEGQRNFIIKAVVACQKNNILQYHIYKLAEDEPIGEGINEFDRMGLYQNLDNVDQYQQVITQEGMAYKTTSDAIGDAAYDPNRTSQLNLPDHIEGAAFQHPDDSYTYVLWAKTTIDNSEFAEASYSLPANLNINLLERKAWDFSQTNTATQIGSENIPLSGAPIFLKDISIDILPPPISDFTFETITLCPPYEVAFFDASLNEPNSWSWNFPGGSPSSSSLQNPLVSFPEAGTYTITLLTENDFGTDELIITLEIGSNLSYEINEELCAGDFIIINGTIYDESNPNGVEVIENGSVNGCDSILIIDLSFAESLEFEITVTICEGESYPFGNEDLTESGTYSNTTTSAGGCDSLATLYLSVETSSSFFFNITFCQGEVIDGVVYEQDTFFIDTISSVIGCDSLLQFYSIILDPVFFTTIDTTILEGQTVTIGTSTYSETGTYIDILTAQNGCDSTVTLNLTVDIVDALIDEYQTSKLKVFPNPFSKKVQVLIETSSAQLESWEVFDFNGQQIRPHSSVLTSGINGYYFDLHLENHPGGIYWLRVKLSEGVLFEKLILL